MNEKRRSKSEAMMGRLKKKGALDLFQSRTQKATALKMAANSMRVSSGIQRKVGGGEEKGRKGVIHLRFWRGLSAPCHSSILPRKHKEHYA